MQFHHTPTISVWWKHNHLHFCQINDSNGVLPYQWQEYKTTDFIATYKSFSKKKKKKIVMEATNICNKYLQINSIFSFEKVYLPIYLGIPLISVLTIETLDNSFYMVFQEAVKLSGVTNISVICTGGGGGGSR